MIEEPDYLALPELVRQQLAPEAAYVDGKHSFEYVLLDFFYLDKLLPVRSEERRVGKECRSRWSPYH